jgi:hypothetical protein
MDETFELPDDENGDVLRGMQTNGEYLSCPQAVEF